jgi:uncharacterized caspase-like protein
MASSSDHQKLALVIVNNMYDQLENRLDQSRQIADSLEQIGFKVTMGFDLGKYEMTAQIIEFSQTINDGDLTLFYYSGHGCQVRGKQLFDTCS